MIVDLVSLHSSHISQKKTRKMTSVCGKTALVTGAGSGRWLLSCLICLATHVRFLALGINLCFARLLVEKGCNVAIADIKLRAEAQELVDRYGASRPGVIFIKTDVAHWDQLQHAMDVCEASFGEIDIVCPGAGIFEPVSRVLNGVGRANARTIATICILVSSWNTAKY